MDVHRVSSRGLERLGEDWRAAEGDGFLWIDIPQMDAAAAKLLEARLGLDPDVIGACGRRIVIPKIAEADGALLLILHSLDDDGHLLQITQVIGDDFLLTVHGPLTDGVPLELALRDTRVVALRLAEGHALPKRPIDLARYVLAELAEWLSSLLVAESAKAGALDRRLRQKETGDAEEFLAEAFAVRHSLLTLGTRAAQTRAACAEIASIARGRWGDDAGFEVVKARFDRLRTVCQGEMEFLQGVLDFYEHQVNTKMNIAMERLSVIAAVALPITAVGGLLGMNTIVNAQTDFSFTFGLIAVMMAFALGMLLWAKRHGWW